MSETPIPVLLTGRTETIGRMVVANLKPEYEGRQPPFLPSTLDI